MTTSNRLIGLALAAALLLGGPAWAQQDNQANEDTSLNVPAEAEPEESIDRIEDYLNGIRSMQGRFLQTTSRGGQAEGDFALLRPGRVRFDYDPPEPTLLVADGMNFVIYDRELEQATMVPLSRTPLWLLLREDIRLDDGLDILEVDEEGDAVSVVLRQEDAPEEGTITLVFEKDPLTLRLWDVVDAQGVRTRVELYDLDYETRPSRALFNVQDLPGIRPPGFDRIN